jgi:hypothetical protein
MARKNVHTWTALDAVDMSTDQISAVTDVQNTDNIGITVAWSGTAPVGELFVEVSNDMDKPDEASWIWTALDFGFPIPITGNSDSHIININFVSFSKLRIRYARTSGVGALTAKMTLKQAGG